MKLFSKTILIILLVLGNKIYGADTASYKVFLVQGSLTYEITPDKKHVINLNAEPFEFRFEMANMTEISLSANHDSGVYKTPFSKQLKECPRVGPAAGSETNLNEAKDIIIYKSGDGYLKWFYKSDSNHRFDSGVIKSGNTIYAKRTIRNYWYLPHYKEKSVAENKKKLYVTFFNVFKEPCEAFKEGELVPDRRYVTLVFQNLK
ncbi:MAG: hypothetical protein SGJ10_08505 [Bacteroidota bacterium]|nr:hypothetical protein [Bacteroidota bacterium]